MTAPGLRQQDQTPFGPDTQAIESGPVTAAQFVLRARQRAAVRGTQPSVRPILPPTVYTL
jgi:hypothetical protein